MGDKKEYPIEVALSLTTNRLLCASFHDMHECAEWILNHPIWTHEFALSKTTNKLKQSILNDAPELAEVNIDGIEKEDIGEWLQNIRKQYGKTVMLSQVPEKREKDPANTMVEVIEKTEKENR